MIYEVHLFSRAIINYIILDEKTDPIAQTQCVKRMSIFAMQCKNRLQRLLRNRLYQPTYLPTLNCSFPEAPVLAVMYTVRDLIRNDF